MRKITIFILAILNFFVFLKLNFFLPQILGQVRLLDFQAYFNLLDSVISGQNPYQTTLMQTLGPPLVFAYYIPYYILGKWVGQATYTATNLVSGFLLCAILAKTYTNKYKLQSFLAFTLVLFSAFPTRFSIEIGQPSLVLALLITIIITSKKAYLKSLGLSLLISIKTFYIFTFFTYLRTSRKVLIKSTVFLFLIIVMSSIFIKPKLYIYYLTNKLPNLVLSTQKPASIDYYNQSLRSTLYRLEGNDIYPFVYIISILLGIFLIFHTAGFEQAAIIAILLSPISWQHYYVIVFPLSVSLLPKLSKHKSKIPLFFVTLFLWWVEFPALHTASPTLSNNLLASHYFFSGLILLLLLFLVNKSSQFDLD